MWRLQNGQSSRVSLKATVQLKYFACLYDLCSDQPLREGTT